MVIDSYSSVQTISSTWPIRIFNTNAYTGSLGGPRLRINRGLNWTTSQSATVGEHQFKTVDPSGVHRLTQTMPSSVHDSVSSFHLEDVNKHKESHSIICGRLQVPRNIASSWLKGYHKRLEILKVATKWKKPGDISRTRCLQQHHRSAQGRLCIQTIIGYRPVR